MKYLSRGASAAAGLLVFVLVAITAASVVARYVFAAPFQWTEELSGLLMIWIVFLGAIACEYRREHLTIDALTTLLPARLRDPVAIGIGVLSLVLLIAMAWLGWELSASAVTKRTRLLGISWFWIDLAVVVGALGMAAVLLGRLVAALRGRGRFEEDSTIDLLLAASETDEVRK